MGILVPENGLYIEMNHPGLGIPMSILAKVIVKPGCLPGRCAVAYG